MDGHESMRSEPPLWRRTVMTYLWPLDGFAIFPFLTSKSRVFFKGGGQDQQRHLNSTARERWLVLSSLLGRVELDIAF
jgi:hypothetical protein